MAKFVRLNMTDRSFRIEDIPTNYEHMGGRWLSSSLVAAEVPPQCHPLGPGNKVVFAPGMITGTIAPTSARVSVGGKSPLTGGIKESNAGGTAAQMLARLGIKALIIEGLPKADKWYNLHVTKDGVTVQEETELLGKGNFAVIEAIEARLGKKTGVLTIGVAGELKMTAANISVKDPDSKIRSHGRGGLGAVMGSKKLKFISIDDQGAPGVKIADPEKFKTAARTFAKALLDHPVSGEGLPTYGTNVLVNILNEAGGLPTRNFTQGQFAAHEKISGETMHDTIVARGGKPKHGCHAGCIIQCSQVYHDKEGKYVTSGFEYETIWGLGADCCVEDLDDIAVADNLMDDIGIDSIETAVMFGVAPTVPAGWRRGSPWLPNTRAPGSAPSAGRSSAEAREPPVRRATRRPVARPAPHARRPRSPARERTTAARRSACPTTCARASAPTTSGAQRPRNPGSPSRSS